MDFRKFAFNNVIRNFKAYLGYFLSSSFSIMIFFAFAVSMFHPMISNSGMSSGSTAFMALMTTEAIIFGFSMLFIIYSLSNFIKSRSREFGTLIIMGMSEKQFKKLVLLENLIIGGLSIIFGIILGLLLSKVFLGLLSKIFYMDLNSFYLPTKAIIITIVVFIILFILTGPFTLKLINKKGMLDLLKGDKKPKAEIKPSKIKGILGIVLILISYALVLFGNRLGLNIGMYIIATMSIIGIYLFFSQFTVLLLTNIKKKEDVYKKKTNMLLISNLVYKMRDNAKLLFIITILLSGTLISLSVSNTIVETQGQSSKSNFPMVYSYFSNEGNPNKTKELDAIENTIKKYNYKEINIEMLDNDFEAVLNVNQYNKLAKHLKLDTISLKDNEAYLVPRYPDKYNINKLKEVKQYDINNNKLTVVGTADKGIFPNGMFNGVVVINNDLYSSLEDKYKKIDFYGFDYDNWENTGEETNKLVKESFNYDYDKERTSYFLTLPNMYLAELQQSQILQFMGTCIGVIFFIAVLSFLYFRLFTDEAFDKVKYDNLGKVGLSYKNMRKIVSIEIGSLFLMPFIVATVNTIVAVVFVNDTLSTGVTLSDFKILGILFVVYIMYFVITKNKYIKNIWTEK